MTGRECQVESGTSQLQLDIHYQSQREISLRQYMQMTHISLHTVYMKYAATLYMADYEVCCILFCILYNYICTVSGLCMCCKPCRKC